ncbi:MAG: protein arginine kinase [Clostridia bacterium]|nr:protein arginine kinase [Clostridia bacterium]
MDSRKWYEKSGTDGDVVISTRIRLARNLEEFPFPARCTDALKQKIADKVKDAVLNSNSVISSRFECIDIGKISPTEVSSLVDRRLISPEFAYEQKGSRQLLLMDDESVSIMINEEDHVRLQVMCEGFDLDKAYEQASRIDTMLDERLKFAFSDTLGYLTQCPTNLGTGMRASVMLHLPALREAKAMGKIAENLSKLGMTIRGAYGENSNPDACLYQLSNQITLGISEKTAIENLRNITKQLIAQELKLREKMAKQIVVRDKIYRAEGILKSARVIETSEAIALLSKVRFGVTVNLIDNISLDTINRLLVEVSAAEIMRKIGKNLAAGERDVARAEIIRASLG